ncbi:hypothetical protein ACFPRL_23190 [Pseudoclavibacter helvolus]
MEGLPPDLHAAHERQIRPRCAGLGEGGRTRVDLEVEHDVDIGELRLCRHVIHPETALGVVTGSVQRNDSLRRPLPPPSGRARGPAPA